MSKLKIKLYCYSAQEAESTYYRDALSWVCGGACMLGLTLTLLLPKLTSNALIAGKNQHFQGFLVILGTIIVLSLVSVHPGPFVNKPSFLKFDVKKLDLFPIR